MFSSSVFLESISKWYDVTFSEWDSKNSNKRWLDEFWVLPLCHSSLYWTQCKWQRKSISTHYRQPWKSLICVKKMVNYPDSATILYSQVAAIRCVTNETISILFMILLLTLGWSHTLVRLSQFLMLHPVLELNIHKQWHQLI